jgi:DNA helicase HerA-like ATPase
LLVTNANYADYSFLFTLHTGDQENSHLKQEYLAVLETSHHTPYFLNLHYRDVAHTVILGRTGSGKSFLLNFLITNLQKYEPYTFIFDLGGSFGSLTQLFGGSYLKVGIESRDFKIKQRSSSLDNDRESILFSFGPIANRAQPIRRSTWPVHLNAASRLFCYVDFRSRHGSRYWLVACVGSRRRFCFC